MGIGDVLRQLRDRRVIRTAVIYVALLWVVIQAADLFANAGMMAEATVRSLIVIGVVGLPVVLVASWFLESPFKGRRWLSVLGDVSVIIAIAAAAGLFAWQQWITSFTRPIVAVLPIVATDLQDDTVTLANHMSARIRNLLASRPEIRVIELSSAQHPAIGEMSAAETIALLSADFAIAGTLSRGGDSLRLTTRLLDRDANIVFSEIYNGEIIGVAALQKSVIEGVAPNLPLASAAMDDMGALIDGCKYPANSDAVLAVAGIGEMAEHIASNPGNGLLHHAQAVRLFNAVQIAPPIRKPVLQQLAQQALGDARQACPKLPQLEILQLINTNVAVDDIEWLNRHPNSAELYRRAGLFDDAHSLDPTNAVTLCHFIDQQPAEILAMFAPGGCST